LLENQSLYLRVLRITTLLVILFTSSVAAPAIDYKSFSHSTHVTKQKLACDSCHKFPTKNWKEVRKGDAAFPDVAEFPEHSSCLNPRQQFFARERPAPKICSNCASHDDFCCGKFRSSVQKRARRAAVFTAFGPNMVGMNVAPVTRREVL